MSGEPASIKVRDTDANGGVVAIAGKEALSSEGTNQAGGARHEGRRGGDGPGQASKLRLWREPTECGSGARGPHAKRQAPESQAHEREG